MEMSTMTADFLATGMEGTTAIPWNESLIWMLVAGFIVAFLLSFAVGANDVANSFGTSVGSKVLTLKQACILATIFETAGAVFLGAKVGETIRKGIIDVTMYQDVDNGVSLLMLGELSAMFGSAVWQLIATVFKLPVSGTHSIVGACIGFSLVAIGTDGVNWAKLGLIIGSWFISPVLCGLMSVSLYLLVSFLVLKKENPLRNGLILLPVFYSITIGINAFSILFSGAPLLGFDNLPLWAVFVITICATIVTGILVRIFAVPRIARKAESKRSDHKIPIDVNDSKLSSTTEKTFVPCDSGYDTPCDRGNAIHDTSITSTLFSKVDELSQENDDFRTRLSTLESYKEAEQLKKPTSNETETSEDPWEVRNSREDFCEEEDQIESQELTKRKSKKSKAVDEDDDDDDDDDDEAPEVRELFSSLQVLTSCFASFAHGGNDVSNAIGPLIALWLVFWSGGVVQKAFTPWYLLVYGGLGICVGLWVLGRRVIQTIGSDLTKVTPSRGFCIELMTAITVLIASNIGLPVSTTHCKVGAVVSVGWLRSRAAVDWSLARNIALAWFVTVPVSGLISAGTMWILMQFAL